MKRNLIFFCAAILSGLSISATHATNAEQVKAHLSIRIMLKPNIHWF